LLQREIGDVTWYALSLDPELSEAVHTVTGARVRFVRSSAAHRALWRAFYLSERSWRWQGAYPAFEFAASYLAPASLDLLRAMRRERPDLIFSQDYASGRFDVLLAVARALGIPLVAYHSGSVPDHYVGRLAKQITIRSADRLLVSSEVERRMLMQRFSVPAERVAVLFTPIDVEEFRPHDRDASARRLGLDPRKPRLLFLGRLDDDVKRVSLLIGSFAAIVAEHPEAELLIAGSGSDEEELRNLAQSLAPGHVRFLGWISGSRERAELLSASDCLVLPSLSEGFPTVVGEALACGTPVVASAVGGIPELVTPGLNGWLVPPDDRRALERALGEVLAESGDLSSMREAARRVAEERLAPKVVAARLRELVPLPRGSGPLRDE
jgi:glycosyltransferase involved in cell wall biosynthesis